MTIKYSLEEKLDPWMTALILSHEESGLTAQYPIRYARESFQEVVAHVDRAFRGFSEKLSKKQAALAESDDYAMRLHYDKYLKGQVGSYRVIDVATADLVHGMNAHPGAQEVAIELPPREDTFKRKDVEQGRRGASSSLFGDNAYVTQAAGDRIVGQLGVARLALLRQMEQALSPQREIEGAPGSTFTHPNGMMQVLGSRGKSATEEDIRRTIETPLVETGRYTSPIRPDDDEQWPLFEMDPRHKNTISTNGTVNGTSLDFFYESLDWLDRQVSLSHGKSSTQPKSAAAKNSKNPRFWAHRAEDRVNGILVQARLNLPSDDPTRQLLEAVSEMFSDHIHGLGE